MIIPVAKKTSLRFFITFCLYLYKKNQKRRKCNIALTFTAAVQLLHFLKLIKFMFSFHFILIILRWLADAEYQVNLLQGLLHCLIE